MGRVKLGPDRITINGADITPETPITGKTFYVGNTASVGRNPSDGNPGTLDKPFATIDYAIGKCTASRGDVIYVLPGHSEDPTTSITADVAGISIIGLGEGANRPTITFGAAGAALDITAAGVTVKNLLFDLGVVAATVTNAITITGASACVEGCATTEHATSQFTNFLTATDAPYVTIKNNRFFGLAGASGTSGIVLDGCDELQLIGNYVQGTFSEHAVDNTTPASCDELLRAYIAHNYIVNTSATGGDFAMELDANTTGVMHDNFFVTGQAGGANAVDPGNMAFFNNFVSDSSGIDVYGVTTLEGSAAD